MGCVLNDCPCKRPLTPPPRASAADQHQPPVKHRRSESCARSDRFRTFQPRRPGKSLGPSLQSSQRPLQIRPSPLVPAQPTAGLQLALHSVPPFLLDGPAPDKPTGLSVTIEEPPHRGHGGPPDAPAHPRPLQSVCLSTACSIKFSAIRDSWLKRYVGPTSPPPSPPTDTVTEGDVCAVPWCARSVCVDADSGRVHRTCGLTHAAELKRKTRAGSLTLGRIRARWLHEGWSTQRLRAGPRVLQPAAC